MQKKRWHICCLEQFYLSIKEVAAEMGFDNLSFFGKYVRKHLGLSPNNYRKANNYGK